MANIEEYPNIFYHFISKLLLTVEGLLSVKNDDACKEDLQNNFEAISGNEIKKYLKSKISKESD